MQPFSDDMDSVVLSDAETVQLDLLLVHGVEQYLVELGRDALEEPLDADIPEMPASMARRMQEYMARQKRKSRARRWGQRAPKIFRAIIVTFTAGVLAFWLTYTNVEAFRVGFNNLFELITEDFVGFSSWSNRSVASPDEDSNIFYPEFVPSGFSYLSTELSEGYIIMKYFNSNSDTWFDFKQLPSPNTNFHMTGDDNYVPILINGYEGKYTITDCGEIYLAWRTDTSIFYITGTISYEIAIQIAESVYVQ